MSTGTQSSEFDISRTGTGTAEWSERTENIAKGCVNGCLYCYAAANAARFKQRDRADWPREELTRKALMKSYPKRDGVIMFPSAHDITPFNADAYIRVAKLILAAGNRLLIVSKPRLECIARLTEELGQWKEQILFRFTIGSLDATECKFWEPGAPTPQERIEALQLAKSRGYQISVSIEPMLEGADMAIGTVSAVEDHVTETIWIGKMNQPGRRVVAAGSAKAVERTLQLQSDSEILKLYEVLKHHPKVRWKDSIKEVLTDNGIPQPLNFQAVAERTYPYPRPDDKNCCWIYFNDADQGPVGEPVFVRSEEPYDRNVAYACLAYGLPGKRGRVRWFGITHPLQAPAELRDVVAYMPINDQSKREHQMSNEPIYPSKCPITGRDFFMVIEHPELGDVPTYGGPFDSYTIPEMEGKPDQPFHLRELVQRRYDHDAGCWKEGVETIPLRVAHDDIILALEDKLETADGMLRSLSSWLGAGGYSGSEDINYEDMEKRIRDGVDMFISGAIAREKLDAARYRRLQILGAAPGGSNNLEEGTVLRFAALDSFVDDDIQNMPSRGEAAPHNHLMSAQSRDVD